ncbi:G kinase-anchoring protein 1-like isoform X1 [Diachasmimorpha longicaudata]|uniref:G kinase-anchoring protein 1-like isoform X1 n=1 Tax=Diachasmimorpha longicaudata TaxID=58733 RepID=UPI0030B8A40C
MATTVPSRFAVLALDDDDPKPKRSQKSTTNAKSDVKNRNDKPKGQGQGQKKDDKNKKSKSKKKRGNQENQQWEQWKEKDTMAVEEAYKQELHEALILSKLAYETQIENGIKDPDITKKSGGKKSKKSTMSLEEFNNMGSNEAAGIANHQDSKPFKHKTESDAEFFDRMDKETKEEIIKCKERDMLKKRLNTLDNDITSAQLKVEVEKRDEQILELKDEVETLKAELSQVKERNKKLYQILSLGEMKDKATVLAEVAKLQEIRDELTSEVQSLHAQLEQERSKTRASSIDVKSTKQTNKKRPASENA